VGGWGGRGGKKRAPATFSVPLQERSGQRELAFARRLAVIGGCDVSHFRMDSTMCAVRRHLSSFSS